MIDNYPDTFAVVSIHHGDGYATPWGNARGSFYGAMFQYYPSLFYDALTENWPYTTYVSKFLVRQAVPTDVTIDLENVMTAADTTDVTATVCIEAGGEAKTVRVFIVEVLDHWPTTTHVERNTFRQAAATEDVAVPVDGCVQVTRSLTFDATSFARPVDVKIVAWAQEARANAPAEVYQAAQMRPLVVLVDDFESGDLTGWTVVDP